MKKPKFNDVYVPRPSSQGGARYSLLSGSQATNSGPSASAPRRDNDHLRFLFLFLFLPIITTSPPPPSLFICCQLDVGGCITHCLKDSPVAPGCREH